MVGTVRVISKVTNGGVVGFIRGLDSSFGVWCSAFDFGSSCSGVVMYE